MKDPKTNKADTNTLVRIAGFFFYPFYAWFGLIMVGVFLFPDSKLMDLAIKPITLIFNESSENWEGCWIGKVEHRKVCFDVTYEELSEVEIIGLQHRNDFYSIYSIEGQEIYQVTKRINCNKAYKELTPYIMDLTIHQDSIGFYFKWQDTKGYLNGAGVGEITSIFSNDTSFQRGEFLLRVNINSDTLNFNKTLKVYTLDELDYISYSAGKMEKQEIPCKGVFEYLQD